MKNPKSIRTFVLSTTCLTATLLCGCEKKPTATHAFEQTKSSAKEAGDAAKDTGKVVGDAAEKTWDGIKKGAQEVSHAATNVAGEV